MHRHPSAAPSKTMNYHPDEATWIQQDDAGENEAINVVPICFEGNHLFVVDDNVTAPAAGATGTYQEKKYNKDWKTSEAKKQLEADIKIGVVTDSMCLQVVYNMHSGLYHNFDPKTFGPNYRRLQLKLARDKSQVTFDEEAFVNDT
ncbi:hypothetical protein ACA910_015558 [Epithemia clementina (nom. ined.)]